ncbi:MAG: hypothetical protein ACMVP2_25600 [Imperialibacter sp.]|uniref:hypothetical protein n=1 Tax=Imperialibacter sp. TaxID=2038411 RepID=UPI003A888BDE
MKKELFGAIIVGGLILKGCAPAPSEERMPVQRLEATHLSGASLPFLSTDASGKVILSYVVDNDSSAALHFTTLADQQWSAPVKVAEDTNWFVNWADFPSVISWGDGKMAAHWLEKNWTGGTNYHVKVSRSQDFGASWNTPVTLHSDTLPREHGFVSLVPFPSGRMFASWLDGRKYPPASEHSGHDLSNEMTLMGGYVAIDGHVEGEELLDERVCDCCQTSSVLSDHGLITFYRDRSDDEVRDIAEVRWTEEGWTAPSLLGEDGWDIMACPVNGPQSDAIDEQVAVVWFTAADENPKVQLSLSGDAGEHPSVPIKVSHKSTVGRADVKLIDKDYVAVSWIEVVEETGILKVAVFTIDGQRLEEWDITEISTERKTGFPQLTSDGKSLIIAWTSDNAVNTAMIALKEL